MAAFARQRPQAQGGEPAGGAAIGLEKLGAGRMDADVERRARILEGGDGGGERDRRFRFQPGVEVEKESAVARDVGAAAHVADDAVGRLVATSPDEEKVRLGLERGLGLVEQSFEIGDAAVRRRELAGALAHAQKGPHGEDEDERQERQRQELQARILRQGRR